MSRTIAERTLFYSALPATFGSVRLRCIRPAEMLGAACVTGRELAPFDLIGRDIFVLIKPGDLRINNLQNHGKIVWDVIDALPPLRDVDRYILPTQYAADYMRWQIDGDIIPSCPARGASWVGPENCLTPYWIGGNRWMPDRMEGVVYVPTDRITEGRLDLYYRRAGILLNVRRDQPDVDLHRILNSGIKQINAVTYGIPSLTDVRDWTADIDQDCTMLTTADKLPADLKRLQSDSALYASIQDACYEHRNDFAPEKIAQKYLDCLSAL